MAIDPKTIGGQIECLARLTGAPDTFVEQVRELFIGKGLTLDMEVAPYLRALEEAFRREENIRRNTRKARRNVDELKRHFARIGDVYRRQLRQLEDIRASLDGQSRPAKSQRILAKRPRRRKTRPSGRRTVVTGRQSDTLSMVPGPEDPQ